MKHIFIVYLTLIFAISCIFFGGFHNVYAQSTTLEGFKFRPKFTADKFPEGGTPKNPKHYNQFSFDLQLPTLRSNDYYKN